jgi:hypothetical protein
MSLKNSDNHAVYINALGQFLPGEPVGNDQIEDRLGMIGGRPSRLKSRILKQNAPASDCCCTGLPLKNCTLFCASRNKKTPCHSFAQQLTIKSLSALCGPA